METFIIRLINYFDDNYDWMQPALYRVTERYEKTKVYKIKNIKASYEFGAIYLNDDESVLLYNACNATSFLIKELIEPIHIDNDRITLIFKRGQITIEKLN
jgi:hypothetical protein